MILLVLEVSGSVQTYWTPVETLKLFLLGPPPFTSQNMIPGNWLPLCLEPPLPPSLPGWTASTHLLDLGFPLVNSKPSIAPLPLCCSVIPFVTRDQDHRLSVNLWAERAEKVKASNVNYLIKHRFNLYQPLWNWFSYWEYQKLNFFSRKVKSLVCEIDMCLRIERGLLMHESWKPRRMW